MKTDAELEREAAGFYVTRPSLRVVAPTTPDPSPVDRARRALAESAELTDMALTMALGSLRDGAAEAEEAAALLDGKPGVRDELNRLAEHIRVRLLNIENLRGNG